MLLQGFQREADMWREFDHERILPILGTAYFDHFIHLVTPYHPRGNLHTLAVADPTAPKVRLVSALAS